MGFYCYLSQVRFPSGEKLYWFRSARRPVPNTPCIAWARGKKTEGKIASSIYCVTSKRSVEGITGFPASRIAPLISYAVADHSDTVLFPIGPIQIPSRFQASPPCPDIIAQKYRQIVCDGMDLPLVVSLDLHILQDGYASYLVYRMLGRETVPVVFVYSSYGNSKKE